jgi:transcriptional/translational regulatory protein YebC/TACO1
MLAAADAGADDFEDGGEQWVVTCEPTALMAVKDALEAASIVVSSFELTMVASQTVPLTSEDDVRKVLKLVDALEDNDDVQNVYANFDIDESLLVAVDA